MYVTYVKNPKKGMDGEVPYFTILAYFRGRKSTIFGVPDPKNGRFLTGGEASKSQKLGKGQAYGDFLELFRVKK